MSGGAQPAPAALLGAALLLPGLTQAWAQDTDWPTITGGNDAGRYAALDQIDAGNFARLEPVWRWRLPDNDLMANDPRFEDPSMKQRTHVTTPIKIGDRLYVVTGYGIAAAVDPATGATVWQHDPQSYGHGRPTNHGFTHKGPSFWRDPERPEAPGRLIYASTDAILRAIYADEGTAVRSFGNHGGVDLTAGLHRAVERRKYTVSSPATICRDVAIVGSSISDGPLGPDDGPPGDVRGFDVRTGRQLWTFHTVPQEGELGTDTWEDESWRITGGANVWGLMSADEELGLAYLPTSTPTNDWYGGHRRGDNLYAESLIAVDCETGERRWHFQAIHHGLWDYDFAAPAVLGDVVVDGRTVKAAMLPSKQAFLYVFDRETGEPLWPIEERQVPQTGIPGEQTSATQPFPTKPPPFDRQGMQLADVIDFTPEIRAEAERILTSHQYGPIYTPPSERGTVAMPGFEGGASWPGRRLRPGHGKALRAVLHGADPDHAQTSRPEPLVLRLRGQSVRLPRPLRPADLEAAVLAGHRLRHEPRRHRLAGSARRGAAATPEACRPRPAAPGLRGPRPRPGHEDTPDRQLRSLALLPLPGSEGGSGSGPNSPRKSPAVWPGPIRGRRRAKTGATPCRL